MSFPWKREKHINVLEVEAVVSYVKLLIRRGVTNRRGIICVDSRVALGAAAKGRSSSRALNCVLRRLAGLCLGAGLTLEFRWVPSAFNPADAPSRNFSIQEWRSALPALPEADLSFRSDKPAGNWEPGIIPAGEGARDPSVPSGGPPPGLGTDHSAPPPPKWCERANASLAEAAPEPSLFPVHPLRAAAPPSFVPTLESRKYFLETSSNTPHVSGRTAGWNGIGHLNVRLLNQKSFRRVFGHLCDIGFFTAALHLPPTGTFSGRACPALRSLRYPRGMPHVDANLRVKLERDTRWGDLLARVLRKMDRTQTVQIVALPADCLLSELPLMRLALARWNSRLVCVCKRSESGCRQWRIYSNCDSIFHHDMFTACACPCNRRLSDPTPPWQREEWPSQLRLPRSWLVTLVSALQAAHVRLRPGSRNWSGVAWNRLWDDFEALGSDKTRASDSY
jgi:hypothetical protein